MGALGECCRDDQAPCFHRVGGARVDEGYARFISTGSTAVSDNRGGRWLRRPRPAGGLISGIAVALKLQRSQHVDGQLLQALVTLCPFTRTPRRELDPGNHVQRT
jgi:hypothetical protein